MPSKAPPSLFHPKKRGIQSTSTNGGATSPTKPSAPRPAASKPVAPAADDDKPNLPDTPFQEFKVMSCHRNGWKYDVMKFDSRKPVDIFAWQAPIKLNRKELRRNEEGAVVRGVAVKPMLGMDGRPVIDVHGNTVMVDAEGRPVHVDAEGQAKIKEAKGKDGKDAGKGKGRAKQKKIRQVFLTDEATRTMRKEERYPWVMEDASGKEVWKAAMEETSKADTHAFFMPAANNVFNFVPAHRWYKFTKKLGHYVPTLEEAEQVMDKIKKNKDPQVWLLRNRGKAASAATLASLKAEEFGGMDGSSGQSLGPGGRRLRTVDSGMNDLFGDDDDEDNGEYKRRIKQMGGEGDLDEVDFEDDFADDEEKMDVDDKIDEEAKELEERLKKEYKAANRLEEASDDEDDEIQLTKDGKKMKKLLGTVEKNNIYESDEEGNPYASSVEEEEEEEEPVVAPPDPATIAKQQQQQQSVSQASSQPPSTKVLQPPSVGSRATSPSQGGHSIVAKRATSPKAPTGMKLKSNGGSRASSPLAGTGSRATSPNPVNKPNNKRKATDDGAPSPTAQGNGTGDGSKPMKKRKAIVPVGELNEAALVEWLRNTPNATTKDCIKHFTPYLTDDAKRTKLKELVKEVAQLNRAEGTLMLKKSYQAKTNSNAPSPAA